MDMTLNLTYNDGMNVMEALSEAARKLGRDDDRATREEYCAVLDAGLTALGIHVSIDTEPKSDDDYDEDDEPIYSYEDYDEDYDDDEDYVENDEDEDEDEEDDSELNSLIDKMVDAISNLENLDDLCELWGA